jgi:hypothetical protein
MRVLIFALFVVAYVLASDASCPGRGNRDGRWGTTLSFSQNKELIRSHIRNIGKRHRHNTLGFTQALTLGSVPSIDEMPRTWISPGIGPNRNSNSDAVPYQVNGQPAITCQIDCMSKVSGNPAYGTCNYRFYKYGAYQITEGCFAQNSLNNDQVNLVKQICEQINGCRNSNWRITRSNVALASGRNTFIERLGGRYADRR